MLFWEDLGSSAVSSQTSRSRKEREHHKLWEALKPSELGCPSPACWGRWESPISFLCLPEDEVQHGKGKEGGNWEDYLRGEQLHCVWRLLGEQQQAVTCWGRGAIKAAGQGAFSLKGSLRQGSSHCTRLHNAHGETPLELHFHADRPLKGLCHMHREYLFEFRVSKTGVYSITPVEFPFLFFFINFQNSSTAHSFTSHS